jgi:hypothetical protein
MTFLQHLVFLRDIFDTFVTLTRHLCDLFVTRFLRDMFDVRETFVTL